MSKEKMYEFDLSGAWHLRVSVSAENDNEAELKKEEILDEIRELVTSLDVDFEDVCCYDEV